MAKRFSDALTTKVEDFERPPNLPAGHYTFQVLKHPDISVFESRDGVQFDRVTYTCAPVAAGEDVDPDDLAKFGDFTKVQVRKQFLIPDGEQDAAGHDSSMYRHRQFLEHMGISEDVALGEALAESVGAQFLGELTHRPDKQNPEIVYQEIGRTALAE
jgi:hypothetical protein